MFGICVWSFERAPSWGTLIEIKLYSVQLAVQLLYIRTVRVVIFDVSSYRADEPFVR